MIKLFIALAVITSSGDIHRGNDVMYFDSVTECAAEAEHRHMLAQEAATLHDVRVEITTECVAL